MGTHQLPPHPPTTPLHASHFQIPTPPFGLAGLGSRTLPGEPRPLCLAAWETEAHGGDEVSQGCTVTPPFKASAEPGVSLLSFLALRRVRSSRRCRNLCRCPSPFAGLEGTCRAFLASAAFWLLDVATSSSPSPQSPTQILSAFTVCPELPTALPAHQASLSPFHR